MEKVGRFNPKRGSVLLILLLLVFQTAAAVADDVEDEKGTLEAGDVSTRSTGIYPEPNVTVTLDRDLFLTEERTDQYWTAFITGTVRCELPPSVPSAVSLSVQLVLIIDVSSSNQIKLGLGRDFSEQDFRLDVYPVVTEKAGTRFDFFINVYWEYSNKAGGSGEGEDVEGSVEVSPFGSITLSEIYMSGSWEIVIGKPFTTRLQVKNNGNSDDLVNMRVRYAPNGFNITFDSDTVSVGPFGFEYVGVTILQANGDPVKDRIEFRAESSVPGETSFQDLNVIIMSRKEANEGEGFPVIAVMAVFGVTFFAIMIVFFIMINRKK
jgi:hypothetical protein